MLASPASWRSEQTGGMLTPPSARTARGRRPAAVPAARSHSASAERGGRRASSSRPVQGAAAVQRGSGGAAASTAPTTPRPAPSVLESTRDVEMETGSGMASSRGLSAAPPNGEAQGGALGCAAGGETGRAPPAAQAGGPAQQDTASAVSGIRGSAGPGEARLEASPGAGDAPAAQLARQDSAVRLAAAAPLVWARGEDEDSTSASFLDEDDPYDEWMLV